MCHVPGKAPNRHGQGLPRALPWTPSLSPDYALAYLWTSTQLQTGPTPNLQPLPAWAKLMIRYRD